MTHSRRTSATMLRAALLAGAAMIIPESLQAAPQILFGGHNGFTAGRSSSLDLASLRPDQNVDVSGGVLQVRYDDGTIVSFSPGARFRYAGGVIDLISGSVNVIVPNGSGAAPQVQWQGRPVQLFAGSSVGLTATESSLDGRVSRGTVGVGGETYQRGQAFRSTPSGSELVFAPTSQSVPGYQPASSGASTSNPPGVDPSTLR